MAATSLEIAFTRAFNELVQDGTWALTFGGAEVESSSSCSGAPENWPLPTPEEGSDLQRVLDSGEFKCGFPSGLAFSSEVTIGIRLVKRLEICMICRNQFKLDGIQPSIVQMISSQLLPRGSLIQRVRDSLQMERGRTHQPLLNIHVHWHFLM